MVSWAKGSWKPEAEPGDAEEMREHSRVRKVRRGQRDPTALQVQTDPDTWAESPRLPLLSCASLGASVSSPELSPWKDCPEVPAGWGMACVCTHTLQEPS